jgi:uncharacterized membrane protein YozB (DUF420 family)
LPLPNARSILLGQGILGTPAPLQTDLALILELAIGIGLLLGAFLARRHLYRAHAICQSSLVLLNLVLILAVMVPSLKLQVLPRIPARFGKPVVAVAATHATLGTIAEFLALYTLVAAGTNWLPPTIRIRNYKMWMRSVLAVWWSALLFGIATYARWYLPHLFR